MKFFKIITLTLLFVLGGALSAQAAELTQQQIDAVLSLLRTFEVSESTVNSVQTSLTGIATLTPSSSSVAQSGVSNATREVEVFVDRRSVCHQFAQALNRGKRDATTAGEVSELQKLLKELGHYGFDEVTGYFGYRTEDAVKKFQKAEGLVPPDATGRIAGYGGVGPKTRAALIARCQERFGIRNVQVAPSIASTNIVSPRDVAGSVENTAGEVTTTATAVANTTNERPLIHVVSRLDSAYSSGDGIELAWNKTGIPAHEQVSIYLQDINGVRQLVSQRAGSPFRYNVPSGISGYRAFVVCNRTQSTCGYSNAFTIVPPRQAVVVDASSENVPDVTTASETNTVATSIRFVHDPLKGVYFPGNILNLSWIGEGSAGGLFNVYYEKVGSGQESSALIANAIAQYSMPYTLPNRLGTYRLKLCDANNTGCIRTALFRVEALPVTEVEPPTTTTVERKVELTSQQLDEEYTPGEGIFLSWRGENISGNGYDILLQRNGLTPTEKVIGTYRGTTYFYRAPQTPGTYQLFVCPTAQKPCAATRLFRVQQPVETTPDPVVTTPEPEPEPETTPVVGAPTADVFFNNITASSRTVDSGDYLSFSWRSSNATSCSASGNWSGARSLSGGYSTGILTNTTSGTITKVYTLSCTSSAGVQATDTITINVNPAPVVVDPTTVRTISVNGPIAGKTYQHNEVMYLKWQVSSSEAIPKLTWTLRKNGVVVTTIVPNLRTSAAGFQWVVGSGIAPGTYTVRAEDASDPSLYQDVRILISGESASIFTKSNVANAVSIWDRISSMWGL